MANLENMSEAGFETSTLQIQAHGSIKLASSIRRANPRVEGISLTPAEHAEGKVERLKNHIRKEEERRKKKGAKK